MSNDTENHEEDSVDTEMDLETMTPEQREQAEKDMLRSRLRAMGISYSNNAGVETLRAKVNEAMEAPVNQTKEDQDELLPTVPEARDNDEPSQLEVKPAPLSTVHSLRNKLRREANKLIRIRVQNMDPKKKDLPGEILTVANEYIGTIRKFVPYGEATDDGWHVPYALYEMMKERRFMDIRTSKNKLNGQLVVTKKLVREFNIEVLPQLTPQELKQLGAAQLAAGTSSLSADE